MKPYAPLFIILFFLACTACIPDGKMPNRNSGIDAVYGGTDREIWQKFQLVIDIFGDLSDKTVVDLGTGKGYCALALEEHSKEILALDINQVFVAYVDSIAQADSLNIEARLVKEDDPLLAPQEADAVIMCNTYCYLDDRVEYLNTLSKGLTKGSKVVIVDFKKKKTRIGPELEARLPLHQVVEELNQAGYIVGEINDTSLDYQYIIAAISQ